MSNKIIQFINKDLVKYKSWRNSIFFGWKWIVFIVFLTFLFLPLFVFGVFLPLVLAFIILITTVFFYKFRIKNSVKIVTSLLLGIGSFILNVILILIIHTETYLFFSSLSSFFLLIIFYTLVGLTKFNFIQTNKNSKLSKSALPLTHVEDTKVSQNDKVEVKNFNVNDKLILLEKIKNRIKDVIEVSDFKQPLIPKKPKNFDENLVNSKSKNQISNHNFNHINKNLINLSGKNIFYLNSLQLPYKRSILDYKFFEVEIVKLYLEICNKTDEILRKRGFSLEEKIKQAVQEYSHYSNTLYTLFCISEFSISNYYLPNKKDISPEFSFKLLNKQFGFTINNKLKKFVEEKFNNLPNLPKNIYYIIYKNAWKNDLKTLLKSNSNLANLKQKCDELLELNSRNPSQYLVYFELCKQFAKKSKTASLWYYFKYYELLSFKNGDLFNSPAPKSLPASVKKIIFIDDQEKLKKFEIICKTRNSTNNSEVAKKEQIKDLFRIKRKELKLDLSETQKAHQTHLVMAAKLNQVLQEEENLENQKDDQKQISQNKEKAIDQTTNLIEFFESDTNSDSKINFTEIESGFLSLFKENNFELGEGKVSNFAKSKKQFKNSLIKKINQKFYQIHEDNLIEQEDEKYFIHNYYQKLI